MANGDFTEFLTSLGAFESGINTTQTDYPDSWFSYLGVFDPARGQVDPSTVDTTNSEDLAELQYHVHNTLGFLGKYQFGEPLLIDLGYYTPASTGYYGSTATNEWEGTWTGKNGVYSKEDFMSEVQELAIREAFAMNMQIIETRLAQAGTSIDDFIGKTFTYTQGGVAHEAVVSVSGILASAHLQGPGGVANLLLNGVVSHDEYGTNILSYMDKFGDFTSPFGTAADDVLTGSDYTETFNGGDGVNEYTTGGGNDKIILSNNPDNKDVITDFDVNHDVISLQNFTALAAADIQLTQEDGSTTAVLPNGQTVVFQGVTDVTAANFVKGYYTLGWNSNSGDTVIENFNTTHDIIDLNYAFASNNLHIYEENGSAVIEVVGNNQRMVLEGIPLAELKPYHFIKAPTDFAEVNFGEDVVPPPPQDDTTTPPPVDNQDSTGDNGGSNNDAPEATPGGDGLTYSFTWNWGSHPVISDFDTNLNKIDLSSFWTSYSEFAIADNANGDAVIDLTNLNNQTITLENVSALELTQDNFLGVSGSIDAALGFTPEDPPGDSTTDNPDPTTDDPAGDTNPVSDGGQSHSYTWAWGSHDVIDNFNVEEDTIDLSSFWTNYQNIDIYDDGTGNVVLDLTELNNQSITLQGVNVAQLTEYNILGVSGNFDDALTDTPTQDQTSQDASSNDGQSDTGQSDTGQSGTDQSQGQGGEVHHQVGFNETLQAEEGMQDVFSFTWNWGSNNEIQGFTPGEDVLDLHSFWTTPDHVNVYDDLNGNAVVDLTDLNNQTITLDGVSSDQLTPDDIVY